MDLSESFLGSSELGGRRKRQEGDGETDMRSRAQGTLEGCSENRKPPFQQREARVRNSRWGGICVPGSRRIQGTSVLPGAWSHPFLC